MKKIVIFSGAGLSAESGIPTFRDNKNGLWENYDVEDVATPGGWKRNPKLVLQFYADRYKNIKSCEPNDAHRAIAKLQEKYEVINITQNIDDLLERAGCKTVWHLHGQIARRKCEKHKNIFPYYQCDYDADHDKPVEITDACPKCESKLRPDVVWFEESVDMREDYLQNLVDTTDVFIGIGTSAQVYPAAGFLWYFQGTPIKIFIDPDPSPRLKSYLCIIGAASQWMPKVTEELMNNAE